MKRRVVRLGTCCVVAASFLFIAGCGGGSSSSSSQTSESLATAPVVAGTEGSGGGAVPSSTWVFTGAPASLDFYTSFELSNFFALGNVLQGMEQYGPEGESEPALAESSEQVNPTTYKYSLNPKAKFSNGEPVLASDVAYTMNYARDPKNGFFTAAYYEGADVKEITAEGPHTVIVRLSKPNSLWAQYPAYPAMWVLPQTQIEEHPNDLGTPAALPIGSGPYKIVGYSAGQSVTLEPNPYWEGPKPAIKKLTLSFVSSDSTRLIALKSGQADGTFQVPLPSVGNYERLSNFNLLKYQSNYYGNVSFMETTKPFDDVHIRRMFAYASDRQGVIDGVLGGNAAVAQAQTVPSMWITNGVSEKEALEEYAKFPQYPFDMKKAKEELEKSKYAGEKVSFDVDVNSEEGNTAVTDALQNTAQNLEQIGVEMHVKALPAAQLYGNVFAERATNGLQALAISGFGDIPNGLEIPYLSFYSKFATPSAFNVSYYKSPEMDKLLLAALESTNKRQSAESSFKALSLSMKDLPELTLWWENTITAVNKNLAAENLGAWSLSGPWALDLSGAKSE
jgi:peptide/nickel transport system substrate-binding protein